MNPALGWLLVALDLGGCAAVACQPQTIGVARKEERARPESTPGLRTTETGRREAPPLTVIRDYWVEAEDGTWHRVSAQQFQAAEVDGRLEICR